MPHAPARYRWFVLLGAATLAPLLSGSVARAATPDLQASIRRTEYGIPHILASNFLGLGYGFGYAFAQDDICVMADDYVTVDAQRSRVFGPSGTYAQRGNGVTSNNEDSDLFWQQVIDSGTVERLVALPPPLGMRQEVRDLISGYVAGWNRYLGDIGGSAGVPDPTCRGAAWVHPITEMEAYRRFAQLLFLASSGVAVDGIATAQPPGLGTLAATAAVDPASIANALSRAVHFDAGSNAVAIGSAGSRDHTHGVLLGNPHFPWVGTERFYEAQLTIPGVIDVSGAMLFGVPLVLIGRTATMAWSHTVSTARRFTLYQLTLVPGTPTSYLVDGVPTPMTSRMVTVQERQPDGSLKALQRTLYSTRYGPIVGSLEGIPLPWTAVTAFAMRDANADDVRSANSFLETDMATSAAQVLQVLQRYQGIPWVNTIVADSTGHAMYADIGVMPNVPDSLAQQCDTAVGVATFALVRIPTLDGSRTSCDWLTDPDAVEPGLFGPSHMPHLLRSDYVTNSNDSYWLSNPQQPLEGYASIIGDERTERSLRTRVGLLMTQGRVDGSDGLGPAGFTRQDMQNEVFADRVLSGELTRDSLVTLCSALPGGLAPTSAGPPVSVGDACDALANWDLHDNLTSTGALLFHRFWAHAVAQTTEASAVGIPDSPTVFLTPFSASDPVKTPNTLNIASPVVITALGDAVSDLQTAHIPPGDRVGSRQGVVRGGQFIPIHGGTGDPDGEFNAIYAPFTPQGGYRDVNDGSSFIQVVTWNGSACPDAVTMLTYSLSTNPLSPHSSDQTRLFSAKQWVRDRFCEADIAASGELTTTTLAATTAQQVSSVSLPDSAALGPLGAAASPLVAVAVLGWFGTRARRSREGRRPRADIPTKMARSRKSPATVPR
jgi:acyl-homoserine-lactone acylase